VIPTLILVGLGLGLMPWQWERRIPAIVALSLLIALAWGLLVGAPLGGALLALVNIALGIPLGLGVRRTVQQGVAVAQRTQRR
jgi:hypothetical protein